jgi:GrpB-like predicted nucleotidyltransferase (UPF0157 family)
VCSSDLTGRTAQSAMLELARQLEDAKAHLAFIEQEYANERNEELTEDALCLKIAGLTHQRDEARAEVERLMHQLADATNESTHFQVMCKRETEEVERLQVACHAWAEDMREAGRLCEQAGNEMPIDAVRRFVSSKTAIVDMLQDRLGEARSEVDRLTDERDELLVRVANQDAELRATREAYNGAQAELTRERIGIRPVDEVRSDAYRRGAEAMREACAYRLVLYKDTVRAEMIRALPIPEEP